MKKSNTFFKTMLLILPILFSLKINSQVEKCGSDQIHRKLLQTDPGYVQKMQQYENYLQTVQNTNSNRTSSVVYKVPVVVNVMHKGEAIGVGTNVSDESIQNAIKLLNQMYRKVSGTAYDGSGVDVEIEYVLAVRDPNGNCTNGINRISMVSNTAYMSNGVNSNETGGISDAALKSIYVWDQNEYYNIWLISEIDNNEGGNGIQGYAYFASSHGTSIDGSVILSSNFTSGTSTTAAHEIGHSLNLYHTFQGDGTGSSCPTDAVCGSSGDCCGDTPPHQRSSSDCVSGTNSCTGTSTDLFIHNYMDYSSDLCQNMLTANQKTRMVTALTTTRASFLESNGNMGLVPVNTAGVDFESSASILCGTGQSVNLTDISTCIPNSYIPSSSFTGITHNWTITNGTNIYTSNLQNPTITFTNTGTFNVTLEITNAHGTTSATKTGMIIVTSGAPVAGCTPTTGNAGNFWQTIYNTTFNSINSSTSQYINSAYTNLACSYNTTVTAGNSYNLSISANAEGGSGNEVFEAYIDYNNDGVFANPSEMIFSGNSPSGTLGTFTTNVTIPETAVQNALLRMRIIGETTAISASERTCSASLFIGDVEDYAVYIKPVACTAPTITGTTPASRCGTGTLSIGATASAGTVNWYTTASGGTTVATGTTFSTPSLSTTTTYYVDATNAGCTTTSRTAIIATITPTVLPSISITQTNGTNPMCTGVSSTFTATPTNGGSTPAYQWKVNGSNVGTNSTTYTTTSLTNGQTVTCILTSNASCAAPTTATSSAVTMTVNSTVAPSVIIAQTGGTNPMCSGISSTFTATPTNGGSTPAYQWKVNGSNVGTNSTTYTTTSLTNGQTVTCILTSNASCAAPTTATSSAVTMTVNSTVAPSVIIAQTGGTNPMCSGISSTFTATPTNGGSTPAYQWKVNGSNVGTNSTTYTTTSLTNGQTVTCVLTSNSSCAAPTTATSSAVTMTVNSTVAPSVIIAQTGGTNPMCSGISSTFTATPTNGGSTPAYQWKVNGSNVGTNSTTYTTTSLTNGQTVTCILTSNASCTAPTTATSSAVTMTVNSTVAPSVIIAQTSGTNPMCSGISSTFTATPTNGGSTPAYQWKVNGSNVGTNSTTYTTTSLTNGQTVTCVLTSNSSCAAPTTATSSAVTMTVNACVTGTAITTVPCGITITNLNATVNAINITGATQYCFKFYHNTTNALIATKTQTSRTIAFNSVNGIYYGNTYKWTVAVDKGSGFGPESNGSCLITFAAPKSVVPCGNSYSKLNSYSTCQLITQATNYRFRFYDEGDNLMAEKIQTSNYIYFNTVSGLNYAKTYKWTIEVQYNNGDGNLLYGPASNNSCTITFNTPQTTVPCGNSYSKLNSYSTCQPITQATNYRFRFYDVGDNLMAEKIQTSNYIYFNTVSGLNYNKTYKWTVEVEYNDPVFGIMYGPPSSNSCTITFNTPQTTVPCGLSFTKLNSYSTCQPITQATNYRFRFYDVGDNLMAEKIQTSNYIYFNTVSGLNYGKTYKWTVEVEYNDPVFGIMYGSASSNSCTITFNEPQTTVPCGNTYAINGYSGLTPVSGAISYRWSFYDVTTDALVATKTGTNSSPYIYFNQVSGLTFNTTYKWTVEVQYNNGVSNVFGPPSSNTCTMTWGTPPAIIENGNPNNLARLSSINNGDENNLFVSIYPNPNNGLFSIDLNAISQIILTNALGQIVFNETMNIGVANLDIQNQPTGIYFVKVIQGGKQNVFKLIKE